MSFFKFFKFSKFLSAYLSFGFLFSGLQTFGMTLDNLGVGNRNQGDDNQSVNTDMTTSSILDGIKVKHPESCQYCNKRVARKVHTSTTGLEIYVCSSDECLKRCFDEFQTKAGMKKCILNTNFNRCDEARLAQEKLGVFKDKFDNSIILQCGHMVCGCLYCNKILLDQRTAKLKCPSCEFNSNTSYYHVNSIFNTNVTISNKVDELISKKLKTEWNCRVYFSTDMPEEQRLKFISSCMRADYEGTFDEEKFYEIDDALKVGDNILVVEPTRFPEKPSDCLKIVKVKELKNYIESYQAKLIKGYIDSEWKDRVIVLCGDKEKVENVNIDSSFEKCFYNQNGHNLNKEKFNKVCKALKDGNKILVLCPTRSIQRTNLLDKDKLNDYIKALVNNGKEFIVYPKEGDLYQKIQACTKK